MSSTLQRFDEKLDLVIAELGSIKTDLAVAIAVNDEQHVDLKRRLVIVEKTNETAQILAESLPAKEKKERFDKIMDLVYKAIVTISLGLLGSQHLVKGE